MLRMPIAGLFGLIALAGCAGGAASLGPPIAATVLATAETEPVGTSADDAADDPAIWHNRADPQRSLIVATDKKAGLYLYGLDGKVRDFQPDGRLNNVDLIDRPDGSILVVASDRNDPVAARLRLYRLDPAAARLVPIGVVPAGQGEAYGVCLWQPGEQVEAFSVLKDGTVVQLAIDLAVPSPRSRILRQLKLASQSEGCVVDPVSQSLFVGEERRGVWQFRAAASAGSEGTLVAPVDGRQLVADVEGLALATDAQGSGWLIVSSQGDNAYALFAMPGMEPAGRFRVARGGLGATEETDGIAVALGDFGPDFPAGLFVVQDGINAPAAQNFKLVSWQAIRDAMAAPGP